MRITVDANILFACLIKDSVTRKLWFNPEAKLFVPEFIVKEFLKYKLIIFKKSRLSSEDFENLLFRVLKQVKIISNKELKPYLPAASTLIKDEKDWFYLACALKENTIIWSNDKELKTQKRIVIKTTSELMKEMKSL